MLVADNNFIDSSIDLRACHFLQSSVELVDCTSDASDRHSCLLMLCSVAAFLKCFFHNAVLRSAENLWPNLVVTECSFSAANVLTLRFDWEKKEKIHQKCSFLLGLCDSSARPLYPCLGHWLAVGWVTRMASSLQQHFALDLTWRRLTWRSLEKLNSYKNQKYWQWRRKKM